MVSGTVTQIDREGERTEVKGGNGTQGTCSHMGTKRRRRGNRGSAQGVKSTGVIHTLLHLVVILAGEITMSGSLEHIIQQQHAVWITPVATVLHDQIDPSNKTCSVLMHHE